MSTISRSAWRWPARAAPLSVAVLAISIVLPWDDPPANMYGLQLVAERPHEAEIPLPAEHAALRGLARERKAGAAEARKAAERIAIEVEEVLWEAAAERSAAKVAQRAKNETLA